MADVRDIVREKYGQMAKSKNACCNTASSCCGTTTQPVNISTSMGYSENELKSVPDDANLGLGCGNPTALASLKEGEVVLDLGSGGGLDCFLAAQKVGDTGRVIGVDMTPEMISLARKNAEQGNDTNVEFRLGEIENLPVGDNTVDVVISNCVVNLSPDKERVFREAYRALRPGGRLMISDIVLLKPLPDAVKESIDAYVGCVAGALLKEDYLAAIRAAGFKEVVIQAEKRIGMMVAPTDPFVRSVIGESNLSVEELKEIAASIVSIQVQGSK
ncbi:MAG: arsenite methyltransferase [Desulfobacteraceae bacterium]|jgi:ubiquinone/menaquinone biosynthesis C-methylase UbiE